LKKGTDIIKNENADIIKGAANTKIYAASQ
jgi:hypothetical protein